MAAKWQHTVRRTRPICTLWTPPDSPVAPGRLRRIKDLERCPSEVAVGVVSLIAESLGLDGRACSSGASGPWQFFEGSSRGVIHDIAFGVRGCAAAEAAHPC
jgi:hypothetical protein